MKKRRWCLADYEEDAQQLAYEHEYLTGEAIRLFNLNDDPFEMALKAVLKRRKSIEEQMRDLENEKSRRMAKVKRNR